MFSWLDDLWDTVVNATTSVSWGDVGTSALTTSLAGAAVGALASAVSDGDIGEGLLYGAAGGLVSGGLMEFGDQFIDEWNWAGNQATPLATEAYMSQVDFDLGEMAEFPEEVQTAIMDVSASGGGTSGDVIAQATQGSSAPDWMKYYQKQESNWYDGMAPVALQIGGGLLTGLMSEEPESQSDILAQQRKYELEDRATAGSALASVYQPRGAAVIDKSNPMKEDFSDIQQAVEVA